MYAIPPSIAWAKNSHRRMPDRIGPQFPGPGDREKLGAVARYDAMVSVPYIPLRDWRLSNLLGHAQLVFALVTR